MIKAVVAFKKAIASIKLGDFLIFRFFFDALGISDTQSKGMGKALADTQDLSDSTATSLNKVETDSSTATDATSLAVGISLSDTGSTSDQINTFAIGKALQDSSNVTEDTSFDIGIERADVFYAAESISVDVDKVRSNLATLSDAFAHSIGRGLSDTIGSSDSGSMRGQGYCAFDYFSADYVGYTQSF